LIQIDDAGSGSLVGGTCIGLWQPETQKYYYGIVPVSCYNEYNFPHKKYLDCVIEIVESGFEALSVNKDEKIEVCRGYMFDKLRKWLTQKNYIWESTQITGELQYRIEKTFARYALSLGFPIQYITYTKYPFHFHRILRWVYADYENRVKLCKVGWKSWQKYGNLPIAIEHVMLPNKNYLCLKCGKPLEKNARAKALKYVSNRPNTIYLHEDC